MVSADGHCRPFDASASGTIFGSGAGVVLLKRLEDAIADGDHVYAVILGCGLSNDGAGKVGFTAPSLDGQAAAIEQALAQAGIGAGSVGYVECHGTATPLGDPIEVAALTKAFRKSTEAQAYCAIGSVKGNIGHLDAAAGVAGLIKTALMLRNRELVPSLNFEAPNPHIAFEGGPFFVNTARAAWPDAVEARRAGVTSLGVGGTNAHVVLEEPPARAVANASSSAGVAGACRAVTVGAGADAGARGGLPGGKPGRRRSPTSLSRCSAGGGTSLIESPSPAGIMPTRRPCCPGRSRLA